MLHVDVPGDLGFRMPKLALDRFVHCSTEVRDRGVPSPKLMVRNVGKTDLLTGWLQHVFGPISWDDGSVVLGGKDVRVWVVAVRVAVLAPTFKVIGEFRREQQLCRGPSSPGSIL